VCDFLWPAYHSECSCKCKHWRLISSLPLSTSSVHPLTLLSCHKLVWPVPPATERSLLRLVSQTSTEMLGDPLLAVKTPNLVMALRWLSNCLCKGNLTISANIVQCLQGKTKEKSLMFSLQRVRLCIRTVWQSKIKMSKWGSEPTEASPLIHHQGMCT
jgi:hypothetical protein